MSLFVDLIILAILLLCIFLGYKKGLVGVLLKLFSFILSLLLSFILVTPISNIVIDKTSIDEKIESAVVNFISGDTEKKAETSSTITNYINNYVSKYKYESQEFIAQNISKELTKIVISIATFIVLFIIIRIVLFFVSFITNALAELPIIKQINISGGVIYGIIEGLFIIYFALAIISFLDIPSLQLAIKNSIIGSILYDKNLILMFLF